MIDLTYLPIFLIIVYLVLCIVYAVVENKKYSDETKEIQDKNEEFLACKCKYLDDLVKKENEIKSKD